MTKEEYKALVREQRDRLDTIYEIYETKEFTEIIGSIGGDTERIRVYRSGLVGCK